MLIYTRQEVKKMSKGKGWFGQSQRHRKAAIKGLRKKGIRKIRRKQALKDIGEIALRRTIPPYGVVRDFEKGSCAVRTLIKTRKK